MKSNALLRIAARVRSDLLILDDGCGVTRSGDDFLISDILIILTQSYILLTSCQFVKLHGSVSRWG